MSARGQGRLVARILAGSWRVAPPPVDFSAYQLESVERQLMASGAAGLAWNRIRGDERLTESPVGLRFADALRMHTLHAGMHRAKLGRVLKILRDQGIEPILFKGWDSAQLYPDIGMRPFGDIDLMLMPEDLVRARSALQREGEDRGVDLEHPIELRGSSLEEMFDRARRIEVTGVETLALSEEDRLRVLSTHFLKSGGWRPLNLCDIAAAVETGLASDERACLTDDRVARSWTLGTIGLAQTLLGADQQSCSISREARQPPSWLTKAVLRAWEHPYPAEWGTHPPVMPALSHPLGILRELGSRWPDPVSSTVMAGTAVNSLPRLPSQLAYLARRTAHYLATQKGR